MPELPEVETSRLGILPYLKDQTIQRVVVRQKQLRWPVPANTLSRQLAKQTITDVRRRGKYLLLDASHGSAIIHLGMSGSLRIVNKATPLLKHDHVDFVLANQDVLRYNDPRRFGAVLWTPDNPLHHPLLSKLGPEPLTRAFNADYLWQKAQGRSQVVKAFIMDSAIVVGVGNIYASEALFLAGIKPDVPTGSISLMRYRELVRTIKKVLRAAIKQGGTTLRDYIHADGTPGYFKQSLFVYGRAGQPCYQCGRSLSQKVIAQRSSVYCGKCQQ